MTNEHQEPRQRTLLEGTRVYLSLGGHPNPASSGHLKTGH